MLEDTLIAEYAEKGRAACIAGAPFNGAFQTVYKDQPPVNSLELWDLIDSWKAGWQSVAPVKWAEHSALSNGTQYVRQIEITRSLIPDPVEWFYVHVLNRLKLGGRKIEFRITDPLFSQADEHLNTGGLQAVITDPIYTAFLARWSAIGEGDCRAGFARYDFDQRWALVQRNALESDIYAIDRDRAQRAWESGYDSAAPVKWIMTTDKTGTPFTVTISAVTDPAAWIRRFVIKSPNEYTVIRIETAADHE